MAGETVKCIWCRGDKDPAELRPSEKQGGLVCGDCDADQPRNSLGEIEANKRERARAAAWNQGRGWVV